MPIDRSGHDFETERYIAIEEIGRGGSSVVVRALDKDILRDVAIKILDPRLTNDGQEVDRFAEEARITGQLEHPSIVPIYELGNDSRGRRFLCMKLIEGMTFEETILRLGDSRLDPAHLASLLQVFVKVCDAVSFAHSRGVLHRDIKPKNVMISDFGQVYVLDWGIARLLRATAGAPGPRVRLGGPSVERSTLDPPGSVIGTACYMAPEQLLGRHEDLDERADVFALGATLYHLLAGRPPLTAEILRAIWTRQPPPPVAPPQSFLPSGRVPLELSRIASRAIAYDPSDRYGSVAELQRDIEAFQRGAWDLPRLRLPAGTVIVREGEPGDAAYVILEGRCLAYQIDGGTELTLREMGPGEVFGETAVFSHKPRTASVKAATEVALLVVTGEVLSKALGLNSWTGAFVRALADRFREADQKLRVLERSPGSGPGSLRSAAAARLAEPSPSAPRATDALTLDPPAVVASAVDAPAGGPLAGPLVDANVESFERAVDGLPHVAVEAGSVIIAQGDSGDSAYFILKGRCLDYRMDGPVEVALREMGPGDVIGEVPLLSGGVAASCVKAMTDVVLVVVHRELLTSALQLDSWTGAFIKALAERLREANDRLRAFER